MQQYVSWLMMFELPPIIVDANIVRDELMIDEHTDSIHYTRVNEVISSRGWSMTNIISHNTVIDNTLSMIHFDGI
jgi:hypothetical protein